MRVAGSQLVALNCFAHSGLPAGERAGCLAHGVPGLTVLGPGPLLPWSTHGCWVMSGIGPRVTPSHCEQPIVHPFLNAVKDGRTIVQRRTLNAMRLLNVACHPGLAECGQATAPSYVSANVGGAREPEAGLSVGTREIPFGNVARDWAPACATPHVDHQIHLKATGALEMFGEGTIYSRRQHVPSDRTEHLAHL